MGENNNRKRLLRNLLIVIGVLLIGGTIALVKLRANVTPPHVKHSGKEIDPEEVERLRSLGYLDFVPAQKEDQRAGVLRKSGDSYPGYNFFTNAFLCMAVLMDNDGKVVNYWHQQDLCDRWANAEFLSNGDILVIGRDRKQNKSDPRESLRFLEKLSWDGKVVWRQALPAHHDVEVTPSGHLLALTVQLRTIPEIHPKIPVRDNSISLLTPDGEQLESVSLYDLFRSAGDTVSLQPVGRKTTNEIDLIHANSVEWIRPEKLSRNDAPDFYSPDCILFTTRHQDTIGLVNWKTKKIVWAWGQGVISGPHDATLLANGNILLFDNGLNRGWSRIIELNPISRQIVWTYQTPRKKDFYTADRGSNQRLPNGNTLITESDKGHAFEITPDGHVAWDYLNQFKNAKAERATIVRMYRFETAAIENIIRTRGAGRTDAPVQVKTSGGGRDAD